MTSMMTLALQARGATLEWPLLTPADPLITVHDPVEADWLHLLIGEAGHVAFLTDGTWEPVWDRDLAGVLRRLAFGHWLRAWWPASPLDGVPPLDHVLLDAELTLLTDHADEVLARGPDERIPLDVAALQAHPHPLTREVLTLLGEDVPAPAPPTREDYALAAGDRSPGGGGVADALLRGTSPHAWQSVPAGRVDAAEHAVTWTIDVLTEAHLHIAVHLLPGATGTGIAVRANAGSHTVTGELRPDGTADLTLPMTAAAAWALSVDDITVDIGVPVSESPADRQAIRDLAAARLAGTAAHHGALYQAERELILDDW